jgi:DNA-binding response OmpR family regulator
MRILLVSPAIPEASGLHKAFQESASHEPFDAVVVLAADAAAQAAMLAAVPHFENLPDSPILVAMMRSIATQDRIKVLRAGADACLSYPWSFIEIHERMLALYRSSSKAANETVTAPALSWVELLHHTAVPTVPPAQARQPARPVAQAWQWRPRYCDC